MGKLIIIMIMKTSLLQLIMFVTSTYFGLLWFDTPLKGDILRTFHALYFLILGLLEYLRMINS